MTDIETYPKGIEIITWLDDCTRYALDVSAHRAITTPIVKATFRKAAGQHGFPASTLTDNGKPNHPTTQGKVESFQQTMKKWLRAQPIQPATIEQLQVPLDLFVDEYNHRRPHRSLPHQATPATLYETLPKALPTNSRDADTHDRIDKTGAVTLRVNGKMHHIGVGRTHARTHVILLIHDLNVRVVNAITGELLRDLEIDQNRDYQGRNQDHKKNS